MSETIEEFDIMDIKRVRWLVYFFVLVAIAQTFYLILGLIMPYSGAPLVSPPIQTGTYWPNGCPDPSQYWPFGGTL